jgi:transposase
VETTSAPKAEGEVTPKVYEALKARELLPGTHLVDTGFLDAELMVTSKAEYSVDLLGPARPDVKLQAKRGEGFDAASFMVDWERQGATCPVGRKGISWTPAIDNRSNHMIEIKFSTKDCKPCPSRDLCVRSGKKYPRRTVTVREYAQYEALQHRRERVKTTEYAREYARRAGIEGTISGGVRSCGLRRSRYAGLARTHLGHVLTAAGINFSRVG